MDAQVFDTLVKAKLVDETVVPAPGYTFKHRFYKWNGPGPGHLHLWHWPEPDQGLVPLRGPVPRLACHGVRLHPQPSEALGGRPELQRRPATSS
eukprot:9969197-Alexandrium_andersonii.AAC.1